MDESGGPEKIDSAQTQQELSDPPLPLSAEQWKSDFKRLIRRSAVSREMGKNTSLNEIITKVRQFEQQIGLEKLAEELISEEIIIHPKMAEVANFVFAALSKKFPELKAVVLLGSSVHGGAMIREASGTTEPDFDWGIITKVPISNSKAEAMQNELNKFYLNQIKSRFGFSETFHTCFYVNPQRYRSISPKNQSQLLDLLSKDTPLSLGLFHQEKTLDAKGTAVFYLSPSFPTEVNMRNRQMLFGVLSELAKKDKEKWKIVIKQIYEEWRSAHNIKHKHFLLPKDRDWEIARNVVSNFGADNLRAQVMWELLKATGK